MTETNNSHRIEQLEKSVQFQSYPIALRGARHRTQADYGVKRTAATLAAHALERMVSSPVHANGRDDIAVRHGSL
jgi:hypothetical protein